MSIISPIYGNPAYRPMERGRKLYNKIEKPLPKPLIGSVWLRVPYADKDLAKQAGARWDAKAKHWYALQDSKLQRFFRWIPKGRK